MDLDVFRIPAFQDNYLWVIRSDGKTAVVDPGDDRPIRSFLDQRDWGLDYIWNTHHHADHVGGNLALKSTYGCTVVGPGEDQNRIPGIDQSVNQGDVVTLGNTTARVLFTPGHTRGHICYYFNEQHKAFVGDTLFAMGCGRLFEGTPEQMWTSLQTLRSLPSSTEVYCAHEYTEANGRFALSLDPDNAPLKDRMQRVLAARERGEATVPFGLAEERSTNPFFRADDQEFKASIGMADQSAQDVFTYLRLRKDHF